MTTTDQPETITDDIQQGCFGSLIIFFSALSGLAFFGFIALRNLP